ncbi:MAG TPA: transcription antitermination factor NusB [Chromatiales bacterium]|nr:transcription antitermination factor NusB [Chromatiales bacterium]
MSATARDARSLRHGRHWARRLALQALYQWDLAHSSPAELLGQFTEDENWPRVDAGYFQELVRGVIAQAAELDAQLVPCLDRPMEEVDPVERAVLRIAAYELRHRLDVPFRVVIEEAVNLAKKFGAEGGYRFVNGVLDRLARRLRPFETSGR